MLTSVTFERYRAFERLTCDGLARVNLFVGRNNSGKTTILEGIEALVGGPEAALVTGPNRRGEQLVDEIDTGLHDSVLEDLWRLVIKTAARLDVQVFATTHSRDCLHGLAGVLRDEPDLAPLAAVHRVERGIPNTTLYTAQELVIADRASMEIR